MVRKMWLVFVLDKIALFQLFDGPTLDFIPYISYQASSIHYFQSSQHTKLHHRFCLSTAGLMASMKHYLILKLKIYIFGYKIIWYIVPKLKKSEGKENRQIRTELAQPQKTNWATLKENTIVYSLN